MNNPYASSIRAGMYRVLSAFMIFSMLLGAVGLPNLVAQAAPASMPPVADDQEVTVTEDISQSITLIGSDSDQDPITFTILTQPAHGSLTGNAPDLTYSPNANYNGLDSFTFGVNDGTANSNIATVNIMVVPVNDTPVAFHDAYSIAQNDVLDVPEPGILDNDSDIEASPLTAVKLSDPSSGTLTFNANGSFVYTPATNFHGAVSFTYQANDGVLDSNIATVAITVTPNDYRLSVAVVGNGSVTKNPNQDYYHSGDIVQLTALPDTGWQFNGWSGSVTGMDNPLSITISGDTNVTATFTQIPPVCTGTLYVDKDSTAATPNGCSWSWAFRTLQDALTAAPTNGTTIWVAEGTYYPDEGAGQTNDSRDSTFPLENGVSIYGGFAGNETLLSQRDLTLYTTVLSGDIDQVTGNAGNAYHVVTAYSVSRTTVLDGLTITQGFANVDGLGGGLYNQNSSPTLRNLVFSANESTTFGGGMYSNTVGSTDSSVTSPLLDHVTFSSNKSARGGGLVTMNSNAILTDVVFTNNLATGGAGGGMNNQTVSSNDPASVPVLTNVTFSNNTANGGGGLFNGNSNAILTNVTFTGNTANLRGGAILNEGSSPVLNHVTIYNNTAPAGMGAIRNVVGVAPAGKPTNLIIRNSILWGSNAGGDADEITADSAGFTTISNSVVENGCQPASSVCTNIVADDPMLGALANNGGFTQTLALGTNSSAIDAGENATCAATDQRGTTRPQGAACDAGAYEAAALTTLTLIPVTGEYSGTVNLTATLTYDGAGVNGKTIYFTLNGANAGSATTDASGIATLHNVSLMGINTATHANAVTASFAGDSAYPSSNATTDLVVTKATPVITWANPDDILQGTPLSGTQLNAAASVPGTFVYDPPLGTVLNAGNAQTLSLNFTPEDALNYNNASATVTINIYACYTLTVGHTGQGTDPAADPDRSSGCPAGTYRTGEIIQLGGATPATGWHIVGWSGTSDDASTAAVNALTMPANDHAIAVHYLQDEYTLEVISLHGTVTIAPDQDTYHYNDVITLSVTADPGWTFHGWAPSLTDNKVTIIANTTVTANYVPQTISLTYTAAANGTLTGNASQTVNYGGDGTPVTAVADAGYHFVNWSDGLTTNPRTDTNVTANVSLTAHFAQDIVTHSVALYPGWNLVSFNIHPTDMAVSAVLSSITGNYDLVYAWDASGAHASSGNWLKADTIPYSPDSLTALNESMGFWIHMTAADTLEVQGTIPASTEVSLLTNAGGWNLVSYPASVNQNLPVIIQDHGVGTDFSLIYAYHVNDMADPWKLFDRTTPPFANDLTVLTPGWGYWVKVSADKVWNVSYAAP